MHESATACRSGLQPLRLGAQVSAGSSGGFSRAQRLPRYPTEVQIHLLGQRRRALDGPRSGCEFHCGWYWTFSFEYLIFAEICDCKAERVDLNQFIRDRITEQKDKVGRVKRSFDLDMLARRIGDLVKIHRGLVRSRAQVLNRDLLENEFEKLDAVCQCRLEVVCRPGFPLVWRWICVKFYC